MSGHSKWATTKHRKAAQDAKRSALFSKLSRNITVAAKEGGDPNPDNNASLAAAIEKAKGYSLPKDKIKTAIDKAFGSGKDAANYETVVYEGYGPCGVAILCEALTDNRNRTAADMRAAFTLSLIHISTTKLALVADDGQLIDSFYANNEGDPLEVARRALVRLRDRYAAAGITLDIAGVGTTGYGELLFNRALHADYHTVETVRCV